MKIGFDRVGESDGGAGLAGAVSSHSATFFSRRAKATPVVWCGQRALSPRLNRVVGFKFPERDQQSLGAIVVLLARQRWRHREPLYGEGAISRHRCQRA